MLNPTSETWRLFLHVVAASVWVGGQIVLAGIVPVVRTGNRELLSLVAQQFAAETLQFNLLKEFPPNIQVNQCLIFISYSAFLYVI